MTDIIYNGKKVRRFDIIDPETGATLDIEILLDDYKRIKIPLSQVFVNGKRAIIQYLTDPRQLNKTTKDKPHVEIIEVEKSPWEAIKIPLDYEACDKTASFDEDHGYYKRICKLVRGHFGDCDWSTKIETDEKTA
jgi:hypothetical protein